MNNKFEAFSFVLLCTLSFKERLPVLKAVHPSLSSSI